MRAEWMEKKRKEKEWTRLIRPNWTSRFSLSTYTNLSISQQHIPHSRKNHHNKKGERGLINSKLPQHRERKRRKFLKEISSFFFCCSRQCGRGIRILGTWPDQVPEILSNEPAFLVGERKRNHHGWIAIGEAIGSRISLIFSTKIISGGGRKRQKHTHTHTDILVRVSQLLHDQTKRCLIFS